jgi:hypothetical protein
LASELRALSKKEETDLAIDASFNRFDPLARIFGDVLQDLRRHLRHEYFLKHLSAYDSADLRGDDYFLLDVDAYAE